MNKKNEKIRKFDAQKSLKSNVTHLSPVTEFRIKIFFMASFSWRCEMNAIEDKKYFIPLHQ